MHTSTVLIGAVMPGHLCNRHPHLKLAHADAVLSLPMYAWKLCVYNTFTATIEGITIRHNVNAIQAQVVADSTANLALCLWQIVGEQHVEL